ncbi:MAG: beta-ketoacyl-ACP synthase III [Phycisphaerae bacterium]
MGKSRRAVVTGMGYAVPAKVLTNADFERMVETSDEWIIQRTGIRERHVVADGESTTDLAVDAARKALASAGKSGKDLDLIICATVSPQMLLPSSASMIQAALGATDVPAFDLSAACSGFIFALTTGCQFIENGAAKRVLVIGADCLSRYTDYKDRGSCILFGDGAGAVILEASDAADKGVMYNVLHTDGSGWDFIHIPAGGSGKAATHATIDAGDHYIKMRGREVYKFAVEKMQWLLGDCMEQCGLKVADIDMVIPHQVNTRIIASAAEKFDLPMDKIYMNIDRYGNTSAASIPLAMAEASSKGLIGPGSTLLLVAFGAGLTWGGSVIRL